MAKSGEVTHLFAELSSLDELGSLLGRSARLKYTCLSVSRKYLALGSNSGGAYIFSRDTLKYLQVVFGGTEAGLVVSVSLSPSDQHVAIALSTGHVAVYELNIDRRVKPDRVRYTHEHTGHTVTAFAWDDVSSRVFVGDSDGNISTIFVPTNKSKNLFTVPSEMIAQIETAVYQMEWWKDKLLVSTVTHTNLFDTIKKNFCTIGTKSRDGEYGSCFYVEPSSKCTVIYCARPGSRMWEVDFDGKVLNTHQLKQLLSVPSIPVIKIGSEHFELGTTPHTGQSVSFYKLFHISQYIITWSSKGLYLFDPINVRVMIWTQSFTGIKDMSVYNNDVYLFLENTSVHRLTLLPIYQLFTVLSSRGLWSLSSSLLLAADQVGMRQAVVKRIKKDLLQNILSGLQTEGKNDALEKVKASMEDVSEGSIESLEAEDNFMDSAEVKGHTYLPSGMVIVSEGVQVRRLWEKKDAKVTVLEDKLETTGSGEVSSAHRHKYINEKDSEFQRKVDQTNTYENNELIDGRTNDSNRYEQIKNHDFFNENKMEDNNETSSGIVNNPENVGLDSDKGFNSEINVYLQSEHLHVQVSANKKFDNSGSTKTNLENNLLKKLNYLAQENETISSVQERDHGNKFSHSFDTDNKHPFSSSDDVLSRNIQAAYADADLSPQQNVVDDWSRSTDLQFSSETFNISKANNCEDRISDAHQNATSRICDKSEEAIHAMSQSKMYINGKDGESSASGNSTSIFPILTSSDALDLNGVSDSCSSSEKSAHFSQHLQNAAETNSTASVSYTDNCRSEVQLPSCSELKMARSTQDSEIFQEKPTQKAAPFNAQLDCTINTMAALSTEDLRSFSSNPSRLPTLELPHTDNCDIAQPVKVSKKKKKKLHGATRSVSVDVDLTRTDRGKALRMAISLGDEQTNPFMQVLDIDMDSISITTISSLEEEDGVASPDSLSAVGDIEVREQTTVQTLSSELSLTPPYVIGKPMSRKSSTSSYHEERRSEIIPPLIDRLAAARGSGSLDDIVVGLHQDSPYGSPQSGDHFFPVGLPRASLSALKDGLSMKLKNQTKSFIKTFKEKNILTKSTITPNAPQQLEKSSKDGISQHADGSVEITAVDELNRAKNLAVTAANITDLYTSALAIEKQLRSSAIVNPAVLRKILNEWATQLNMAICRYHEELLKRTNEMQGKEQELQPTLSRSSKNCQEIDNRLRNPEHKISKGFFAGSSSGTFMEYSNPAISQENQNTLRSSVSVISSPSSVSAISSPSSVSVISSPSSVSVISSPSSVSVISSPSSVSVISSASSVSAISSTSFVSVISSPSSVSVISSSSSESAQPISSELTTTPAHKSTSPTYWASVVHSDDPFQLPKKHLDLFRTLATMCFVCGVSGDILSHLNFTEEIHYRMFVNLLLPSPLQSVFNPDCECLMSLFHDSHNSTTEPSHHQNCTNNLRTEFMGENGQNPSSIAPDVHALFSSSGNTVKSDLNISQENESYLATLNNTSLLHDAVSQNDSGHERISVNCSCRSNLRIWSENEQFKKDVSLALFIRLYFFALDYDKVKQALDNHNKMFITWSSLVLCSREVGSGDIVSSILADNQINSAFGYLRSGILPRQSALLGHVYKLFELTPLKTSEFCGEICKTIAPVDLVQFSLLCSKPASSCILRYFKQAMKHSATVMRPEVFRHLCKHRDVRYLLFEALLQPQSTDVFADGIKSLATQLRAVLPLDWLNILLSMIASEEERDRIVQLSAGNGCLAVCVKLLTESDQWQKLLQLIVDVNNISLLKGKHGEDGYIPRNEQEWKFLVTCFYTKWSAQNSALASQKNSLEAESESHEAHASQEHHFGRLFSSSSSLGTDGKVDISKKATHDSTVEGADLLPAEMAGTKPEDLSAQYESFSSKTNQDDLSQDNTITWHSLGYLLLEHVGGAAAIDLLMEHLSDPAVVKNCLKAEFLKACYLDFSIKMEQNHVIHDILERLSVHMWKKKPDFVPSSVFNSISAEKKLSDNGEWEDVAIQRLFNQVKAHESTDLSSKHLGSQWGQEVNMSSVCECCHIPLKSVLTLAIQGVIVFPCGHAFHKTCVSGPTCPVIHLSSCAGE